MQILVVQMAWELSRGPALHLFRHQEAAKPSFLCETENRSEQASQPKRREFLRLTSKELVLSLVVSSHHRSWTVAWDNAVIPFFPALKTVSCKSYSCRSSIITIIVKMQSWRKSKKILRRFYL